MRVCGVVGYRGVKHSVTWRSDVASVIIIAWGINRGVTFWGLDAARDSTFLCGIASYIDCELRVSSRAGIVVM